MSLIQRIDKYCLLKKKLVLLGVADKTNAVLDLSSSSQFDQHLASSIFANLLTTKKYKYKHRLQLQRSSAKPL